MSDLPPSRPRPTSTSDAPAILQHSKRQDWGRAVKVWETPGKSAFQFEDGGLRVFRADFVHMLSEVEVEEAEAHRLAARLQRSAGRENVLDSALPTPSTAPQVRKDITLDDRLNWFLEKYPGGFTGDAWIAASRGKEGVSTRRSHRNGAIFNARTQLNCDMDPLELGTVFGDVVEGTDLVGPKRRTLLVALDEDTRATLGEALGGLLVFSDPFAFRFERWLDRLQVNTPTLASWAVATAPLALIDPENHFFIRRTPVRREASLQGLTIPRAPSAPAYNTLLNMANSIRKDLTDRGAPPVDLLDVYDFIRSTLSPSVQKKIVPAAG